MFEKKKSKEASKEAGKESFLKDRGEDFFIRGVPQNGTDTSSLPSLNYADIWDI